VEGEEQQMPRFARHDNFVTRTTLAAERDLAMSREWRFWVYIMASKSRRIYTGVTNDIERRVHEHKGGQIEGFTRRYRINRLVHLERFHYIGNAIAREKEIKGLDRKKRVALIESANPTWEDLSLEWGKPIQLLGSSGSGKQQIPRELKSARDDNFEGSNGIGRKEKVRAKT
jgi:putative endonuclease